MKQRAVALGGLMTALGVVILLISSVIPVAQAGMAAITGVITAIAVVRIGFGGAVLTWLATTVLALLIVPSKVPVLLFAVFFGPYALVKNRIERYVHGWVQWIPKLLFCTVLSAVLLWCSAQVLSLVPEPLTGMIPLLILGIDLIFIVYDVVFSKLITFFVGRIS
ncbi:MAG: hypothetical protein ACI4PQ_06980 [Butyricicoccaceae bacterium]